MSLAVSRPAQARGATLGPRVQLALAAAIIAAILLVVFVAPLPLWHGEPARPPAAGAPRADAQPLGVLGVGVAVAFALALLLPYRPYALALRAARHLEGWTWPLLALTAALALAALLMFPRFGTDVFEYAAYARLWRVYGENPLLAMPRAHLSDPLVALAWYPDRPLPYGPLWPVLAWPTSLLGGESAMGQALAYKGLVLLAYAACGALVWLGAAPERRAEALVFFAWSPLVLFDALGKGHNDMVVAVPMLAAVVLAGRGRGALGLVAATSAVLIKLSSGAAGLVILKQLVQARRWRALALGALGSLGLALACYLPVWPGARLLDPVLSQVTGVVWSPGTLLILAGQAALGQRPDGVVRGLLFLAWLLVAVVILRRLPVRTTAEQATATALLTLATYLLLSTAFYAHYLIPVIALAAVSADPRLRALVTALSIGALAAYAVDLLPLALGPDWARSDALLELGSLVTLGPALALLAWWMLPRSRRHSLGEAAA